MKEQNDDMLKIGIPKERQEGERRAAATADTVKRYKGLGLEPVSGPPEDFAPVIKTDLVFWKRVITDNNIRIDQ